MLMFLSCSATDKIYNTDAQNISEPDSIIVENSDYKINEETSCTLNGGEKVIEGWAGNDTGNNFCNKCRCINGNLACTKMACINSDPDKTFAKQTIATKIPKPTPTNIPKLTPTKIPKPTPTKIPKPTPTKTSKLPEVIIPSSLDYSNNPLEPTILKFKSNKIIISNEFGGNDRDYMNFNVPENFMVDSIILKSFTGEDQIAFFAIQKNNQYTAQDDISNMVAYGHFGPGSEHNKIQNNILYYDKNIDQKSRVKVNLGYGDYTFRIQQGTSSNASYSFEVLLKISEESLSVIEDTSYQDFTQYIDIETLRIFGLPDVDDQFLLKVASIYKLIFSKDDLIDEELQNEFFKTLKNEHVYQRVGYMGPETYNLDSSNPKIDCCPGKNYEDNHTDYIWDYGKSNNLQLGEIIEHALHTITNVGFRLMSEEWDYESPNSALRKAYQEAVDKKLFNEESYSDLKNRSLEDFYNVTTQEFFFWVIITEWDFGSIWNIPHNEFRVANKQDLKDKLPLSHDLYVEFVEKILNPPDRLLVEVILEN